MAARRNIIARVSEPLCVLPSSPSCPSAFADSALSHSMTIFGLGLDQQPKDTIGRILPPPRVEYKAGGFVSAQAPPLTTVTPVDSAWKMDFAGGEFSQMFVSSGKLSSVVIIVENERDRKAAITVFQDLLDKMAALGPSSSPAPRPRHLTMHYR